MSKYNCGTSIDCAWGCPPCPGPNGVAAGMREQLRKAVDQDRATPAHAKRHMPAVAQSLAKARAVAPECLHVWTERRVAGDAWEECWYCAAVKPDPAPDDLAHRELDPCGSE